MNIEWTIIKKRGNFRPLLEYTVSLTEFECSLCLSGVRVESTIPKPPESSWSHCWPGQNERGDWTPTQFHLLMTPSHKDGTTSARLKLPWREDNAYPEVEASFALLRTAFERALAHALDSAPMHVRGRLETSEPMRQAVAPALAAQRILRAVGR